MHHLALLRRPESWWESTRDHGLSCRRNAEHLLAVKVATANAQERTQVRSLAQDVPHGTGERVTLACVAQGYPGQDAVAAARDDRMHLQVIRLKNVTRGVVLLPRPWVVVRSVGWVTR